MTPAAAAQDRDDILTEWRAEVDDALAGIARSVDGTDDVSGAVRYALSGGGKRLRPILCLAAMEAAGPPAGPRAARVRAAASIELVHTYSLVHDDLPCMDDDDLRRGRPTAHRVFSTRAAMLAGFALVPLACRVLMEAAADMGAPDGAGRASVRELCQAAGAAGMVGGQVLDLEAERGEPAEEDLRHIHRMKTGALFRASLRIGGVLGGATDAGVAALGEFGDRLGLAFQITDDVLDVTSGADVLGKTPGKDSAARKVTFASLLGVAEARRAAAREVSAAVAALNAAGLATPVLEGLAGFAVSRDR